MLSTKCNVPSNFQQGFPQSVCFPVYGGYEQPMYQQGSSVAPPVPTLPVVATTSTILSRINQEILQLHIQ